MTIKKLKVTLQGPLWSIKEFEIEGIDVRERWVENSNGKEGSVTVSNFYSSDEKLDIFIRIGAPNGCVYKLLIDGQSSSPSKVISFQSGDMKVVKNGRLNILFSELISEL